MTLAWWPAALIWALASGGVVDPLPAATGARARVLLFVNIDCPISNRYAPELNRLHEQFSREGVRFWLVYPDASQTTAQARAHAHAYGLAMPILRDPELQLVRRAKTIVTPEAAVFDAAGQLVYHGRIDDRFADFGVQRPQPTARNLQDALAAVLEGRRVNTPTTTAIGCFVPR